MNLTSAYSHFPRRPVGYAQFRKLVVPK